MSRPEGEGDAGGPSPEGQHPARGPHRGEWLLGLVSAALVCALLGHLGYEALTARDGVPVFVVETQAPRPAGEQFLVPITVRNEGRRTAAAVQIEGRLEGGGESVVSTVTLDYVPARGEVDAGLLFPQDPGTGTLTVRVLGYANP